MALETESMPVQQRLEEWIVVAGGIDNVDVDIGRNGSPPLKQVYEQRFGMQGVNWRITKESLTHDIKGHWAKAWGMYPVHVEVSVAALDQEQQRIEEERRRYHGKSIEEWDIGLSALTKIN